MTSFATIIESLQYKPRLPPPKLSPIVGRHWDLHTKATIAVHSTYYHRKHAVLVAYIFCKSKQSLQYIVLVQPCTKVATISCISNQSLQLIDATSEATMVTFLAMKIKSWGWFLGDNLLWGTPEKFSRIVVYDILRWFQYCVCILYYLLSEE